MDHIISVTPRNGGPSAETGFPISCQTRGVFIRALYRFPASQALYRWLESGLWPHTGTTQDRDAGIMAGICARCGREVDRLVRGLCADCFRETYGVARLPSLLHIVVCSYCGSIKVKGAWVKTTAGESLEETVNDIVFSLLTSKVKGVEGVDYVWIDRVELLRGLKGPGIYEVLASVRGSLDGLEIGESRIVKVKIDVGVCPSCTNKITKRGYDAIIQVRSSSGRLSSSLAERIHKFISKIDPGLKDSIISVEEGKNGIDILVEDVASARVIAGKMRSSFLGFSKEAYKLVGRRSDGKRRGRLTISVRIPDIGVGEVIRVADRKYLVIAVGRGGVTVYDLDKGVETTLSAEDLWGKGFIVDSSISYSRLLLISSDRRQVLFTDPIHPDRVIEYPSELVRVLVPELVEGKEYIVLRHGKLIYVVGEAT